jgi:hypothetical protein
MKTIDMLLVSLIFKCVLFLFNMVIKGVDESIKSARDYSLTFRLQSALEENILYLGFLAAVSLAVYQLINKLQNPGALIVLISYWRQLGGTSP